VRSGANCQERHQACPSYPKRLTLAEPVESEIDLVNVLHHLSELLRLHQRRRRRNPLRRRPLRPLRLPCSACAGAVSEVADLRIEEGPMLRGRVLGGEREAAERVVNLLR